jgi:hypothetical protein
MRGAAGIVTLRCQEASGRWEEIWNRLDNQTSAGPDLATYKSDAHPVPPLAQQRSRGHPLGHSKGAAPSRVQPLPGTAQTVMPAILASFPVASAHSVSVGMVVIGSRQPRPMTARPSMVSPS